MTPIVASPLRVDDVIIVRAVIITFLLLHPSTVLLTASDGSSKDPWTIYNPSKPCRPEDGFQKCTGNPYIPLMAGKEICSSRAYFSQFCSNQSDDVKANVLTTPCSDQEVLCVHFRGIACVSRHSAKINGLCDESLKKRYLRCHPDEFQCRNTGNCIPRHMVGDRKVDCSVASQPDGKYADYSDEIEALESCDPETEFPCDGRKCLSRDMVMDGEVNCEDGSDEVTGLDCHPHTEFRCRENGRCIPRYRVHDHFPDCTDGSDENDPEFRCRKSSEFDCGDGRCIPISWVGNAIRDCSSGSDEDPDVEVDCDEENHFRCLDGSRCLHVKYKCDGNQNCPDASDEIGLCPYPLLFTCFSPNASTPTVRLPWATTFGESTDLLSCPDTSHLKTSILPGFKCQVQVAADTPPRRCLIPQFLLHNQSRSSNDSICADHSDLYEKSITCLDGETLISKTQICDGKIDCPDLSDECVCEKSRVEPLCALIYPTAAGKSPPTGINMGEICNGVVNFDNQEDEKFCDYDGISTSEDQSSTNTSGFYTCRQYGAHPLNLTHPTGEAKFCDGVIDCPSMDDECSAKCRREVFTGRTNRNVYDFAKLCFSTDDILNEKCSSLVYLKKEASIHGDDLHPQRQRALRDVNNQCYKSVDRYCDENAHLPDVCPWRFDCKSNFSNQTIELDRVCDYNVDCEGSRDESICPEDSHFKCWMEDKYIASSKYLDGNNDCSDRSDECVDDDFSSPHEMIKNDFLRRFVWVSAVITVIANFIAVYQHAMKLWKVRDKHSISYVNTLLITHLATSDLVMGLSLLIVGFKSYEYSGHYCYHDYVWRSSLTCNMVGILTVISSQTSMNILILLTGLRFYMTCRPFKSNQINYRIWHVFALLAWFQAGLFALVPVWKSDIFTKAYYVDQSLFFEGQHVNQSAYHQYYKRTSMILGNSTSADDQYFMLSKQSLDRFPERYVPIERNFGYYSSSAVCFPDLFSKSSPEFEISFTITIYNLLALIFIAATYVFIYVTYSKKPLLGTERQRRLVVKSTNTLKRRVIYIIVTDAMSWIPIIVMAIMSYRKYDLPGIVHPLSAIVLLPINSALNPMIYSRFDKIIKKKVQDMLRYVGLRSSDGIPGRMTTTRASTMETTI